MKYLKKFETEADKNAWLAGSEFVTPNVVLTEGKVGYNVIDPATIPLHIEAIEDLTIAFGNTYEYSKDNANWMSGASDTIISASAGEKVYFRASGLTVTSSAGIGRFTISNGNCNVGGNIMSMAYGAEYKGKIQITQKYQFLGLFNSATLLVDASSLVLPATSLSTSCYSTMFKNCTSLTTAPVLPATALATSCYSAMFSGCTSLVTAPELPATSLKPSCYNYMFSDCTKLNYIKAMFTTTPGSNYTYEWVIGLASTGTFVKNAAATWEVTGKNGIPEGWTVETATA